MRRSTYSTVVKVPEMRFGDGKDEGPHSMMEHSAMLGIALVVPCAILASFHHWTQ